MKPLSRIFSLFALVLLASCAKEESPQQTETTTAKAEAPSSSAVSTDQEVINKGKQLYVLCQACHAVEATGPRKIGPHLAGVMGRQIASVESFNYSPALKAIDQTWDKTTMDTWLSNPQKMARGNMMAFAGIPREIDRAALIAYLNTL